MADNLLDLIREFDQSIELKYNKFYVGLAKDGRPFNFITFLPRKKHILLRMKLLKSEDFDGRIDAADIDTLDHLYGMYRLRITNGDLDSKSNVIKELMHEAYKQTQ